MANLRDVRLRIRAVKQTLQVTRAMNLISTAKLRKGRRILEDTEPYFTRIQKSMFDILSAAGSVNSAYFKKNEAQTKRTSQAIIVITSDKGLAGGYNANIIRAVHNLCEQLENPALVLIGNIGARYFSRNFGAILESFSYHSQMPTLDNAGEVSDFMLSQFLWGMFSEAHIVYTHMYSSIKLLPAVRRILPLSAETLQTELSGIGGAKRVGLRFEFLPSREEVFDALVPQYIKGIIYGAMVESYVSEQSARMSAMDEASKSGEDMLRALQISYNRARQAGITQEMSEIVGGAAALSG